MEARDLTRGEGDVASDERQETANLVEISPTERNRSFARKRGEC